MMLSLMIGINAQQVTILREVVIVRGKIVMQVVDAWREILDWAEGAARARSEFLIWRDMLITKAC